MISDLEFAEAIDALLWISPSGEMRDNGANLEAVNWSLQERRRALDNLESLVRSLLPLQPWREHEPLGATILEALLFLLELGGGSLPLRMYTEEQH